MGLVLFFLLMTDSAASFPGLDTAAERFGDGTMAIASARVATSDDVAQAARDFDDSAWQERSLYELPRHARTLWLRERVTLLHSSAPLGIYVSALASLEVYWDGELVGSSGAIDAQGRAVRPGPIDNLFILDGVRRSPGEHQLAVRFVAPRESLRLRSHYYGIAIGDYAHMVRTRFLDQIIPVAGLGVFFVVGLYYLSLWFAAGRRRSMLVFALLCFTAALLVVAESYRWLFGYTYDWHIVRLHLVMVLTACVALLLPLFFLLELEVRRRWPVMTGVFLALILTYAIEETFDTRCLVMFWCGIAASAVAIVLAAGTNRWKVAPAATGTGIMAITLLRGGYDFGDRSFFLAFCALILCLLVSLTLETRKQRRERDDAVLRAARLEIELLKRSIQPHFIMNTLTAVMEWIEENPREGVRFLEALADELRIFGEVAGKPLITVARELDLCRSHLTIMGCRKGGSYDLETSGVDGAALIPPAIFHTLIENAMTHNGYSSDRVTFRLEELRDGLRRRYVLTTPLTKKESRAGTEGVGLKYVKARLEEVFPGRWRVDSVATPEQWTTTIEVTA